MDSSAPDNCQADFLLNIDNIGFLSALRWCVRFLNAFHNTDETDILLKRSE